MWCAVVTRVWQLQQHSYTLSCSSCDTAACPCCTSSCSNTLSTNCMSCRVDGSSISATTARVLSSWVCVRSASARNRAEIRERRPTCEELLPAARACFLLPMVESTLIGDVSTVVTHLCPFPWPLTQQRFFVIRFGLVCVVCFVCVFCAACLWKKRTVCARCWG